MANPLIVIRDYVRHSVAELKKVSWPSRELTTRYSVMVVAVSLAMAAFFAALDFGLQQGVTAALAERSANAPAASEVPLPDVTPSLIETEGGQGINVSPASPTDVAPPPVSSDGAITLPPIETPAP